MLMGSRVRWSDMELIKIIRYVFLSSIILVFGCLDQTVKKDLSTYSSGLESKEAPMLARMVKEGKLPPLAERIPENPLVAKTDFDGYEQPGGYGGTWHRFHSRPELGSWKMIGGVYSADSMEIGLFGFEARHSRSLEI